MRPLEERRVMVDKRDSSLSVKKQCDLLEIPRSSLYYKPAGEKGKNLEILRLLDEQYLKTPFYGVRRLTVWLRQQGYDINPKRVKRLMEAAGWKTIYPKTNTSKPNGAHKIYPYLLKGLTAERINQLWEMDITYVPMSKGFMYLSAIIDVYSRQVVTWGVSNTMSAEWVRGIVEGAIERNGKPEIFNTDQGSQFTSEVFTELLKTNGIRISMDGRGRAKDNIFIERLWRTVKYENIYLYSYEDGSALYEGLNEYFRFYNNERLHQSLGYKTPEVLYRKAA